MKLSFRLSALSAVLLLAPLAQQPAPRPIKDRLGRYLAWFAHFVKGDSTPARPEPAPKSGNSGRFGSPLRSVLQYYLYPNLTGERE